MSPREEIFEYSQEETLIPQGDISSLKKKELLYDGVYYDVTNWVRRHPGGGVIDLYVQTGEDSTIAVQQFHQRSTEKVMGIMKSLPHRKANEKELPVNSNTLQKHKALTKDFIDLYKEVKSEGLFDPAPLEIIWRILEVFLLFALGFYCLRFQEQIMWRIAGIVLMGLCYGRAAYLSHEGCHNSLTGIPKIDKFIISFNFGTFIGFSGSWWISQHSRHHAMPQHLKHDVDLQTLPLLAFNSKCVKNPEEGKGFFVRNQLWLFLCCDTMLVTLLWKYYLMPKYAVLKNKYMDILFMTLNYLLTYHVGFLNYNIALWLTSMYLHVNFSLSHSHLPVTDEPTHWVEYSLCHTSNVRSSWWVSYWMGHLNHQIEHHLFPTMPQFRNKFCRDRVKALAKKHNLPYNLLTYKEAIAKSFGNLGSVSKELAAN